MKCAVCACASLFCCVSHGCARNGVYWMYTQIEYYTMLWATVCLAWYGLLGFCIFLLNAIHQFQKGFDSIFVSELWNNKKKNQRNQKVSLVIWNNWIAIEIDDNRWRQLHIDAIHSKTQTPSILFTVVILTANKNPDFSEKIIVERNKTLKTNINRPFIIAELFASFHE